MAADRRSEAEYTKNSDNSQENDPLNTQAMDLNSTEGSLEKKQERLRNTVLKLCKKEKKKKRKEKRQGVWQFKK